MSLRRGAALYTRILVLNRRKSPKRQVFWDSDGVTGEALELSKLLLLQHTHPLDSIRPSTRFEDYLRPRSPRAARATCTQITAFVGSASSRYLLLSP